MKRWCIVASLVVLVEISSAATASELTTIPNRSTLREDKELFRGAFKAIADRFDVLNAYLPGYGVVFMGSTYKEIQSVQRQVERILTSIAPTITSLPAGKRVAVMVSGSGFPEWELLYVVVAGTSGDSVTWEVYINEAAR